MKLETFNILSFEKLKKDDPASNDYLINYSNNITYKGQIKDDRREGKGILNVPNKFFYDG